MVIGWNTVVGLNMVVGWVERFNRAGCLGGVRLGLVQLRFRLG